MRRLVTSVALAVTALPGIAAAAEPPCLTSAEFSSLAGYALPSVISGTTQRCAATLPTGAFLRQNGRDLASRYGEGKTAAWPGAKAAFLKLSASGSSDTAGIFKSMPDSSLQPMLDALIEGMVGQQIKPERCATIDRVVRLLAPLPPENTAELIAVAAGLGSQTGKARVGQFSLCPA